MKRWILAALALGTAAQADDLYPKGASAGLVADRAAENVGDILTIVVVENNLAANTAQNGSRKNSRIAGELGIGKIVNGGAHLNLGSDYEGTGNTLRSGRMAAQFSVAVEAVLPNGDLRIAGAQALNINGERTLIRLRGRVRRADIFDNKVTSSRIADAEIDYGGSGFVTRSTKPGLVTRVFNFLGL